MRALASTVSDRSCPCTVLLQLSLPDSTSSMNKYAFPTGLIGRSAQIRRLRLELEIAAVSNAKVLITGESGVGKEVVARAIHAMSPLRDGPFVAVNCAGIPETLLESELFGHVRGSFTGAHRDTLGKIEMASRGTI